ncbi:MAG: hypothetical protein WBN04_14360 [Paracoccaceae bacterium]
MTKAEFTKALDAKAITPPNKDRAAAFRIAEFLDRSRHLIRAYLTQSHDAAD